MATVGSKRPGLVGKMRDRIEIKNVVRVADDIGGFTRNDTTLGTFYANVITMSAFEQARYEQIDKRITHVVLMRYNASVQRGQTVVWGSRQLYIEGVIDRDNRKRFIELACLEGANP